MTSLRPGVRPTEEPVREEPAAAEGDQSRLRRPTSETAGTGSVLGVGCVLGVVAIVLILTALFYLPLFR